MKYIFIQQLYNTRDIGLETDLNENILPDKEILNIVLSEKHVFFLSISCVAFDSTGRQFKLQRLGNSSSDKKIVKFMLPKGVDLAGST